MFTIITQSHLYTADKMFKPSYRTDYGKNLIIYKNSINYNFLNN